MSRRARSLQPGRGLALLACWVLVAALAACQSLNVPMPRFGGGARPAERDVMGSGSVRVALLLPRSARGNGAETARAFRNAAELAIKDFPDAGIQVVVYDTQGTPAGAESALSTALGEGAEMVLGPVFSSEVAAIAPEARQAGKPVVAFSSDSSVAGPGIYLLSFLPSDDVNRIVAYSASQGRKSFAALLPANAYGSVVEAAFRSAVANQRGRVVAVERYQPSNTDIKAKTGDIARISAQVDALFIPDGGEVAPALGAALAESGITRDKVRYLGSGQWDDPRILSDPSLVGSWFPAPDKRGFEAFARKYQAAYGAAPPRNATLAYDATVLAAGLVRQFGSKPFDSAVLTSPNGFAGLDGVFRFRPGGLPERRLAVYEVTGSGARIVSPAARSFGAGG